MILWHYHDYSPFIKSEDGTPLQELSSFSFLPPPLCCAPPQASPFWHCAADQETWLTLEVKKVALAWPRRSLLSAPTHLSTGETTSSHSSPPPRLLVRAMNESMEEMLEVMNDGLVNRG